MDKIFIINIKTNLGELCGLNLADSVQDLLVGCHEHYNGSLHSITAGSFWTAG
jgi:hypothetical protein